MIRLADDTITKDDRDELTKWLGVGTETEWWSACDVPWLTQGELVREFERKWAGWLYGGGQGHAVFVNSGSSANLLMYAALLESGRLANKRIIVPAVGWPTTIAPALQLGFEPVMVDAEWETFGIDESKTLAIDAHSAIIVHVLGVPARVGPITRDLNGDRWILEDACAAMGSRYATRGNLVGALALNYPKSISSFSLYFGHHLSSIEGGMVCTRDEEIYHLLLMLRSHGWAKDLPPNREELLFINSEANAFNRPFSFYHPGFNVRSTDLAAKLALSQWERREDVFRRRIEIRKAYEDAFSGKLYFPSNPLGETCPISFPLLAESTEHRRVIAKAMANAGIETRPISGGAMHRQPFWQRRYPSQVGPFPVADAVHDRGFICPVHPGMTDEDVRTVVEVVTGA